jgi:protein-S-isoprenylcysteine O-methyltransferase Ste14
MALRYALLSFATLLIVTQVWGYYLHFRHVGPPTWQLRAMAGLFLAAYLIQAVVLWPPRALPTTAWLGLPFQLCALGLWAWATWASGRHSLPVAFSSGSHPGQLITHGPYRLVRHPFYVSYSLGWCGGAVATLNWLVAAAAAAATAICVVAARREERRLAAGPLREPYEIYRATTGMFIPKLIRPPQP